MVEEEQPLLSRAQLIEQLIRDGFTFVGVRRNTKDARTVWIFQPPNTLVLDQAVEAMDIAEHEVHHGE